MEADGIKIVPVTNQADFATAKKLILEYTDWLGIDLSFQNFNSEINNLENTYTVPDGGLLLALVNGDAAGVAGIKKFEGKACELKRMFVRSDYRNLGLGRMLLLASIDLAKKLKYEVVKLDTAEFMTAAIKLYKNHGFVEIDAYRFNPHESAKYFELVL